MSYSLFGRRVFTYLGLTVFLAGIAHAQNEHLELVSGTPNMAMLSYQGEEVEVDWQYSNDGGQSWEPLPASVGITESVPRNDYWSFASRVLFPAEFPAGLRLRARAHGGFTDPVTIPHRNPFPGGQRLFTPAKDTDDYSIADFDFEGDLIVLKCIKSGLDNDFSRKFRTFARDGDGWSEGPSLIAPPVADKHITGFLWELENGRLIIDSRTDSYWAARTDGAILIYKWMGLATGWELESVIRREAVTAELPQGIPPVPTMDIFGERMDVQGDTLVVFTYPTSSLTEHYGKVYVYQRKSSGEWEFEQALLEEADTGPAPPGTPKHPLVNLPLIVGSRIILQEIERTEYGDVQNGGLITYWRDTESGEWVVSDYKTDLKGFLITTAGERIVAVRMMEDEKGHYLDTQILVPGPDGGWTTTQEARLPYNIFPTEGTDEWLIYAFEPSEGMNLPSGAVAIAPLKGDMVHPDPALIVPANELDYAMIRHSAIDGHRIVVMSLLHDGSFTFDEADLSLLPIPEYPTVAYGKWLDVNYDSLSQGKVVLRFRESVSDETTTRILANIGDTGWQPLTIAPEDITILDPDVDGDGATQLLEVRLPQTVNSQPALYMLRQE